MNTQQKQKILSRFLTQLTSFQTTLSSTNKTTIPSQFCNFNPPNIDIISDLLSHQNRINQTITKAHKNIQNVLGQLSQLQTRKQNVNKLLDCMTAIKQVKKLSYGLGNTASEIYKNLVTYYQIKDKLYYCQRYVEKVQQQIIQIKQKYQVQLQQQLKKTNAENIVQIAKTLNLITQQINIKNYKKLGTNDHILKFYVEYVKKQLKNYQEDIFKIPIHATNTTGSYIFFDIAKDVMKLIVNTLTNYKGNIIKIGGEQSYAQIIIQIFGLAMNGIILQIFMRERKYFDVDTTDSKKLCKQTNKFKDYLNQFCAIWNQIQRLKQHLINQIPLFSTLRKNLQNNLNDCTNTKQLIKINSQTYQGIKIYTRYQFNQLLKNSNFVNSIWQLDYQFLNKISHAYTKAQKQLYQSNEAQDFLVETFSIVMKSLDKVFQSLNMLIISPFITFANNHLIQQDSFHAFSQLFNRVLGKMNLGQSKYYTAIVVLINTTLLMPHALKTELSGFKIPAELENNKLRLQSQLKQLSQVCEYKCKQLIFGFVDSIVGSTWFTTDLKQDYKKTIEKWKGFAHQVNDIFLTKASQLHSSLIISDEFNVKSPKKIVTQQGTISLEKQVRSIISFYEVKGCSALNSFRRVLEYIEIMLAQNQDSANKLIKKFNIYDPQQSQRILLLRAMKVD